MVATRIFVPGTISAAANHIIVGGPSTGQVQDSGQSLVKQNASSADPTVNADQTQGYAAGSTWVNTTNGRTFIAQSVGTGAAVWNLLSPGVQLGFAFGTVAANTTAFLAPSVSGFNQNSGALVSAAGLFSNLYVRTANAPGAGQTFVFTLYVGAPAAMSATGIICTISGASATTANDTTHTAAITAGQQWAIQLVTSAASAATASSMTGLQFAPT